MLWKSVLTWCFCALIIISTGCGSDSTGGRDIGDSGVVMETGSDSGVDTDIDSSGIDTEVNDVFGADAEVNDAFSTDTTDSSGGHTDIDDGFGADTFEAFEKEAVKLQIEFVCNSVFTCPEEQPLYWVRGYGVFKSKDDCIANYTKVSKGFADLYSAERAAMAAGRLEFDLAKATQCISDLKNGIEQCGSQDELMLLARCQNVFTAKVEVGAPCRKGGECVSARCVFENEAECFGRCAEETSRAEEGEDCGSSRCVDGLFCVTKSRSDREKWICVQPGSRHEDEICNGLPNVCADGLTCSLYGYCVLKTPLINKGERCVLHQKLCKPGLVCVGLELSNITQSWNGMCGSPQGTGKICAQDDECQLGSYCDTGSFGYGSCAVLGRNGATCYYDKECASSFCDRSVRQCAEPVSVVCEIPGE